MLMNMFGGLGTGGLNAPPSGPPEEGLKWPIDARSDFFVTWRRRRKTGAGEVPSQQLIQVVEAAAQTGSGDCACEKYDRKDLSYQKWRHHWEENGSGLGIIWKLRCYIFKDVDMPLPYEMVAKCIEIGLQNLQSVAKA
ncbi:hypothetical protein QQ045_017583 [Rhodiola kirilowii]